MKKIAKLLTVGVFALGLFAGAGATKSEASTLTKPAGSNFFKSASNSSTNYYMVQDYKGTTIRAKTTASVALTAYKENYSYGSVSFVDYDKVTKTTYKTTVNSQAYTKASKNAKLTARNNKGKVINVKVPTRNVMTKYTPSWYKDSFKYTTYVKDKGKWVKRNKTATVYVPAKYVKGYTSSTWVKKTKKVDQGFFYTPAATNGVTLAEYNEIEIGMSLEDVEAITGEKFILEYSSSWDETLYDDDYNEIGTIVHTDASYRWEYELDTETEYIWRHADLDFEDGKLTYKSQYGLK
ncbi:hypothetical protein KW850_30285 [Bacillus sp. sid0103]|uniref:hypothetical protein n=1 Tax=Bacillus sp. sid0103 TaxID=2856337 RepID=UPI001C467DD3|nr:hypothetical protein [Bacillus sp. sid0103]MBV7509451.1 hypothetical protein [Bacillus sp. sid0103]